MPERDHIKVGITGNTGFIGKRLTQMLTERTGQKPGILPGGDPDQKCNVTQEKDFNVPDCSIGGKPNIAFGITPINLPGIAQGSESVSKSEPNKIAGKLSRMEHGTSLWPEPTIKSGPKCGQQTFKKLDLRPDKESLKEPGTEPYIELISFDRIYCDDQEKLRQFVRSCTVIVHLAYINRHPDPQTLYDQNVSLTQKLIDALTSEQVNPALIYTSSIRETEDSHYGRSKLHTRLLLHKWAEKARAPYTGLVLPNIYGPGAKPYYNSFIATFCDQLIHGKSPVVSTDREVPLLYIDHICHFLISKIMVSEYSKWLHKELVEPDVRMTVPQVLELIRFIHCRYTTTGIIPVPENLTYATSIINTYLSHL